MNLNSLELLGATTLCWLAYRLLRAAIRATRSTTVLGRQHVAHRRDRWEAGP